MIETVTKKILEMQMQSPKSITKLVKGRQEFAEDDCSNILTTSIITRRRFVVKSVAKDFHVKLCLTSTRKWCISTLKSHGPPPHPTYNF